MQRIFELISSTKLIELRKMGSRPHMQMPPYPKIRSGKTHIYAKKIIQHDLKKCCEMTLRLQILALSTIPLLFAILAITSLVTWQSSQLSKEGIRTFENSMLAAKEAELKNYIELALTAINPVYNAASPDDEIAKERVKEILKNLSFGADGYFYVYHYDGTNIVHPRQPFRIGKDWSDHPDVAALLQHARNGGGYHRYVWEKPSSSESSDKLGYAVGLEKWQWMIGTGAYIDDILAQTEAANQSLSSSVNNTFWLVAFITVPAVLAVFGTGIIINLRERRLADTKLKELTQRIVDTQEEERSRIARELHDGISQNMVGVRYVLDLAERQVREGKDNALATIERGAGALNNAIKEVRRISHDLRPGQLDDLGLTAALESLITNFEERNDINVEFESVAFKNVLPSDAKTAIYRVAQEALNNIERHSGADQIKIRLGSTNAGLEMVITDNGRGFNMMKNANDKTIGPSGGLGLRNMQERMEHFNGHLQVISTPKGTQLVARLPRSIYLTSGKDVLERKGA
jgi:two-component system NarL family sensor kinase